MNKTNDQASGERPLIAPTPSQVVPIEWVIEQRENARKHPPKQRPILVIPLERRARGRKAPRYECIAGSGLLAEARALGFTEIEIKVSNLRGLDVIGYALTDNQLGLLSEWDDDVLNSQLAVLDESEFEVNVIGFDEGEVSRRVAASLGRDKAGDESVSPLLDRAAELQKKWKVREGYLYQVGPHRLLCGDSTEPEQITRLMEGKRADMVFTDPPYGVNVTGKGGDAIAGDISFTAIPLMFSVMPSVLTKGAWVYICGGQSDMPLYSKMFERHFRQLPRFIVWDKGRTAVMRHNGYHSCYEMIYFAFLEGGGGKWYGARDSDSADDIWRVPAPHGEERVHVTQKPVELPARAIRNSCPHGGIVFEPFCGVGATMVGAQQEGRVCFAAELEPKYAAVTLERMSNMGLTPKLIK